MRRYGFLVPGVLALLTLWVEPAGAVGQRGPIESPARPAAARYICVPSLVWRNPELCPSYGPGTTAYRVVSIRLPNPLPDLPVAELPHDGDEELVPHTYAEVTTLPLNVYRHPMEAASGLPPVRTMFSGDWWVSIDGEVEYEGQRWYQINEGEFIPAGALALANPSKFQGVILDEQPRSPFAWILRWTHPSILPQGADNTAVDPLYRYQLVTIFAEERRGDELWYYVGTDQWVEQRNVARVDLDAPPEGVPAGAKWVEVDLFEQTIAAYEGERMVYATLTSSGRRGTDTPPGLYHVISKVRQGKMSNPDVDDGDPTYYFLEDVPWTMYFHKGYGLHAAYWHDGFGFVQSHGCVNLSPRDALWLFNWADPPIPDALTGVYASGDTPTTWVWIHDSPPFER